MSSSHIGTDWIAILTEESQTWEETIHAWIAWWHVYFSDHHDTSSHEYDAVCAFVYSMCLWIMSKMGVCGSSLSRPCQLTDSFMPLCTKLSLSPLERKEEPHFYSFTFTTYKSVPFFMSALTELLAYLRQATVKVTHSSSVDRKYNSNNFDNITC